ncbi:hypothetical protein Tco_1504131 [Tanacetum coccineum]
MVEAGGGSAKEEDWVRSADSDREVDAKISVTRIFSQWSVSPDRTRLSWLGLAGKGRREVSVMGAHGGVQREVVLLHLGLSVLKSEASIRREAYAQRPFPS